ncbi:unnamed protein product, partial [Ectocarpus sp. 12 AP-2014]
GKVNCLDAFIVALNQVGDEHDKRWYASTLELQLVSLAFCGACRSVPTIQVRVEQKLPRSIWYPSTSHTATNNGSGAVATWNGVPVVQAFGFTWALPTGTLPQTAAIELQSGSQRRRENGDSSTASQ